MNSVISIILGTLIFFPFLVTVLFLLIMRKRGKAPAVVIGQAADLTTPFLFLAVYIAVWLIFDEGVGIYIIMIAIVIAIMMIILERIRKKEFHLFRLLKRAWRLYFLILCAAYSMLLLVGIVLKVMEYVT
ncbi:DUF3397 family protein [Sporosarcina sp. HYO08]|uniref:DUF3397 family protein n=1 Tax=Sporosarcina sp. HYO08 TaxID=1759557 RepID=UPI00079B0BEB|nr:DUF3397 family protein [Sporosarcina sp. HYO08]KXH79890.1 hypothetical protein AU377_10455 [Sporosarcina sp. HYO08]